MTTSRLLTVRTRKLDETSPLRQRPLLDLLPDNSALSWVSRDEGLVGWGEAARLDASGPSRFADADAWWHRVRENMFVDDQVALPGTGPVAFTSIAFNAEPGASVLIVPEVVIGERDGVRWLTTIGAADPFAPSAPVTSPSDVRYSDGELSSTEYRAAVAAAVERMSSGDPSSGDPSSNVDKVVLARDMVATTSRRLDSRFLLHNLAQRYPECWKFSVDGLVGATPELLLERVGDQVRSRVLAGTNWPRGDASDDRIAADLFNSVKDRGEHAYAVDSLTSTLGPFCGGLEVPDEPDVLRLRNVMHLATDVSGMLDDSSVSLLRLVEAVHPTAAVGGTPRREAVQLISELERMDRGRYAGPVGWIDGEGNGEFGIALRCAQIQDAHRVRLFAGAGIVAASDPDSEVAETNAKLLPMREALES